MFLRGAELPFSQPLVIVRREVYGTSAQREQVIDRIRRAGGQTARHRRREDDALPLAQRFQVVPNPRLFHRRAGKLRHIAKILAHYIIPIPPCPGWLFIVWMGIVNRLKNCIVCGKIIQ